MSDDLSSTLAGIQERFETVTEIPMEAIPLEPEQAAAFAALVMDIPSLAAAVGRVLKLADEARPGLTAACTCYDCETWQAGDIPGYDDYKPHPGRVLSWNLDPAKVREAITAELAGKEPGDAG